MSKPMAFKTEYLTQPADVSPMACMTSKVTFWRWKNYKTSCLKDFFLFAMVMYKTTCDKSIKTLSHLTHPNDMLEVLFHINTPL